MEQISQRTFRRSHSFLRSSKRQEFSRIWEAPKPSNDKPELAAVESIESARFAPPSDLSKSEARIWRRVQSPMPDGWFRAEYFDLLKQYAQHAARADALNAAARDIDLGAAAKDSIDGPDLKRVDKLFQMAERESRLALARSLRITHQSQVDRKTAGAKKKRNAPAIDWTKSENSEANGGGR